MRLDRTNPPGGGQKPLYIPAEARQRGLPLQWEGG